MDRHLSKNQRPGARAHVHLLQIFDDKKFVHNNLLPKRSHCAESGVSKLVSSTCPPLRSLRPISRALIPRRIPFWCVVFVLTWINGISSSSPSATEPMVSYAQVNQVGVFYTVFSVNLPISIPSPLTLCIIQIVV